MRIAGIKYLAATGKGGKVRTIQNARGSGAYLPFAVQADRLA
jgi:hypothetical protein